MRKQLTSFKILSRNVSLKDRFGRRIQQPRWGRWMHWSQHSNITANLRDAIQYAVIQLKVYGVGTVVYVSRPSQNPVEIYQAKAGVNVNNYLGWKKNPVADYWKRRV